MARTGGIIVAAGRGERMGAPVGKVYLPLGERPVLLHVVDVFERAPSIACYVVVVRPEEERLCNTLLAARAPAKLVAVVPGGETRQDSVAAGLAALPGECEFVAVHDGARPLLSLTVLEGAVRRAWEVGAVVVGVPARETVKILGENGTIAATPERGRLWIAQTPQVFRRDLLARALAEAARDGFRGTDDSSLVERLGVPVAVFEGEPTNLKLTYPEDLLAAGALLAAREGKTAPGFAVGIGYDVHPFAPGRPLVLGGVEIPEGPGLAGHSDADVLLHAVIDACLGAAGLGDIGTYFPPAEERWREAASLGLLAHARSLLAAAGFAVAQVDAVVAAEVPRLAPYVNLMKERIAVVLGIPAARVGVKATTTEGLGFVGRREGIAAWAVALLAGRGTP